MADLSLNLEIKGLGTTNMSMDDAKKLYNELRVLFEEKVTYVPTHGWLWSRPWWGYSQYGTYGSSSYPKGINQRGGTWTSNSNTTAPFGDYKISI